MSVNDEVSPLRLRIAEAELDDLRQRLRRTRLPEAETTVAPDHAADWSQGPPRSYVADLLRYWEQDYDWRRVESELNDHGQALTGSTGWTCTSCMFVHRERTPDR